MEEQITKLEEQIKKLEERIDNLNEEIDYLHNYFTRLNVKIVELNNLYDLQQDTNKLVLNLLKQPDGSK